MDSAWRLHSWLLSRAPEPEQGVRNGTGSSELTLANSMPKVKLKAPSGPEVVKTKLELPPGLRKAFRISGSIGRAGHEHGFAWIEHGFEAQAFERVVPALLDPHGFT